MFSSANGCLPACARPKIIKLDKNEWYSAEAMMQQIQYINGKIYTPHSQNHHHCFRREPIPILFFIDYNYNNYLSWVEWGEFTVSTMWTHCLPWYHLIIGAERNGTCPFIWGNGKDKKCLLHQILWICYGHLFTWQKSKTRSKGRASIM